MEQIRQAWRSLWRRPARTLVTLLQVALGVAVMASALSTLFISRQMVQQVVNSLGQDVWTVTAGKQETWPGGMIKSRSEQPLFRMDDVNWLKNAARGSVLAASPYQPQQVVRLAVGGRDYVVRSIAEVGADYAQVAGLKLTAGSFFTPADQAQGNRVAVLASSVAKALFGKANPVGQEVVIAGPVVPPAAAETAPQAPRASFRVIGVFEAAGRTGLADALLGGADYVLVPYGGALPRPTAGGAVLAGPGQSASSPGSEGPGFSFSRIRLRALPGKAADARRDVDVLLHQRLQNRLDQGAGFIFEKASDQAKWLMQAIDVQGIFLGVLAFLALVVSSISILSVSMVGIVERTREFGLKRALGATRGRVLRGVLAESGLLAFLGGLIGLLAALPLARLALTTFSPVQSVVGEVKAPLLDPGAALIALAIAVVLGMLFGLYPARRAAAISPVEAFREG
ncbi:MAG: ABC transporter permease [Firmicutes bacterium]|nr:ABC transporter permease [Bacillota bacterium]